MRRTNTVPPPGVQNGPQATAGNDGALKGRYKPVSLTPRHGMPTSSSKLSSGYLRSFGFTNTTLSSQTETSISEPMHNSTQQAAVSDDQDLWTLDSCLPPPPATPPPPPPPQEENTEGEKYSVLSESRLNVLSYNLSEIADRISPTKYDPGTEIDGGYVETLMDEDVGSSPEAILPSNDEQPTRFKTPYSRQRRGSKSFVSKQKSFTRRRSRIHHDSQQELNNNGEISFDASNVLSFTAGNSEAFKQDCESDSGYSSSMSASISLSEEVEPSKRPSLENGSGTDVEADDFISSGEECVKKSSVGSAVTNESVAGALSHQNAGNIEERLDTSIHGVSSGVSDLSLNGNWCSETDVQRDAVPNGSDEPSTSFKLSHKNSSTVDENTKGVSENCNTKSAFHLQKASLDDTNLPSKNSKRPGLVRRRTTVVSFRPPKKMIVQEGESDIVEMDEAGFLQMLTDLKSFKTQLLKLKRELQEADVVSPLMHSHSWAVRRGSLSGETDLLERNSLHKKRMTLHRTVTMDATTMQQRLHRTSSSSSSSTGGLVANLDDIVEQTDSSTLRNPIPQSAAGDNEEVKNLREQLEDVKEKLITITEERNSLMIAREELEHELDSKNHTIRMLQKQLESQTDSQDEMAYLKRQVKSLTNQIQQQQQKITELRYRTSSPGSGPMGAISKETVKADIRNRLRDAFVKHLGESSKSTVQLSKFIQKAEQRISMAQKGLSSLYSSPHASTELLPKDKPRPSFQRSDSQSSAERDQEDSDGRESESDASKSARWKIASSRVNRSNEDSGPESGKPVRRRAAFSNTSRSEDEADRGRASDSDCGKSRRQRVASPSFDSDNKDVNKTRLEPDSAKVGVQVEVADTDKASKTTVTTPRIRKLSRSKLLTKMEASPLSHSWTPGAIEKIVKSWRETKSPAASQGKTKEEETHALKPVSHVQFL